MSAPRLVLVKPPDASEFNFGTFSLGVLAAFVREVAHIEIIDATDLDAVEASERVWSLEPDVVGLTVMGFSSVHSGLRFLRTLNGKRPAKSHAPILVGGHGATSTPMPFLIAGATAVVLGEGERTLKSVLEEGVQPWAPGLASLVDGTMVIGPAQRLIRPLDDLPWPARDLMPAPPDGVHLVETSRGCPHRCNFCETARFHHGKWRAHSPARVVAEVTSLVDDHDAWMILFADDNFASKPGRVLEICERLRGGSLPATFLAAVRADDLLRDPALIPAMSAARILRVNVGVETLEPDAAAAAGKPISLEVYREAFAALRAHGIFSVASFIVGLPNEQSDSRSLVDLAVEAGPDAAIFVPFIPMPDTPLARGRPELEVKATDRKTAIAATSAFFRHPTVRDRLAHAASAGGIRGTMARATAAHNRQRELASVEPGRAIAER